MSIPRSVFAFAIGIVAAFAVLAMWPKPRDKLEFNQALWIEFQDRFIRSGRVIDHDNGGISHSEGQGYGMILAEAFGDRKVFDDLFSWTQNHLMREDGLLSWRWEQRSGITDENNATDGDILVAWALVRAAKRWKEAEYMDEALSLLLAIRTHAIVEVEGRLFILPGVVGFENPEGLILNPSYWVYPALDDFAQIEDEGIWSRIADSGEWLTEQAIMSPSGLALDWVQLTTDGPKAAPNFPARFSWDAVRIPLYVAWGAEHRHGLLVPYQRFWEEGYEKGDLPAWVDLSSGQTAPYSAPTGVRVIANMVTERALTDGAQVYVDESYFSSSLLILTVIAMEESGRGPQK